MSLRSSVARMKGMTLPAVLPASSPCSEVGTTPFSWFLSCSLTVRLHETLKQCQNLKTEKNQMDRKISQLSEENGDLSFKVREFANHLQQLQGAFNDLIEEHSKASQEWAEKQAHLENEIGTALQDKVTLCSGAAHGLHM